MVLVTDKQYYIEKEMIEKLDLCLERQKTNWDNLFIVDGMEGAGKSTLTVGLANYIAHKLNKKFTVDNIFFNANDMLDYASSHEAEVIVWDEAATAALASQWQSRIQQKMIQILMMARKKRHFFFFLIPKFWKLNEYLVDRAIGLIHVYSPDFLTRGYYVYFTYENKNHLWERFKVEKRKSYKIGWTFRGKFRENSFVIDKEAYEKKKDEAIRKVFNDDNQKPDRTEFYKKKLDDLRQRISNLPKRIGISQTELAEKLDLDRRTLWDWRNDGSNREEILS